MTISIYHLHPEELGSRFKLARDNAGFTQGEAAEKVGMSRTTLLAIEQGKRSVKNGELISLTDLYKVSMNELLRREAVHVDLLPRFRKMGDQALSGIDGAISILNDFVTAEVELETLLGIERPNRLPPERPIMRGDVRRQAERDATELRHRLGLGEGPVRNLFSLLSMDMGIRVYAHPLEAKVSGLFAYDDAVGACILVNSKHRYERQVQTAGHELGHTIGTRRKPDVCHEGHQHNSREERYANSFAGAFLMPAHAVQHMLTEVQAGSRNLTRRHVIIVSRHFGVSRESFVRRLEELRLVPEGTWDWFDRNGGITDEQVEQVFGSGPANNTPSSHLPPPSSIRLETLAAQVLDRDLMSEGQIAKLLKIDRYKARLLREEGEAQHDDAVQLSL